MATTPQADVFAQAHADAQRAVSTFLPSLTPQPPAAPPPPPPQTSPKIKEGVRALSVVRNTEQAAKRVARGLPAQPPALPSPQESFPPAIDQVHIRAMAAAIAAHPETERPALLHEAHLNLTKWIAAKNGSIVHDGHIEIAGSPESAEKLAAKIINEAVDGHDQREQAKKEAALSFDGERSTGTSGGDVQPSPGNAAPRPPSSALPAPVQRNVGAVGGVDSGRSETDGSGPNGEPAGAGQLPPVGATDPASGRTITQSSPDLDEAQDQATAAAPELKDTLGGVADSVDGAEVEGVRESKDPDRAQQKADVDEKPVHTQTDLLAGRIAVDSPEAKDAAVQSLKDTGKVIDEDDHFQDGDPEYGFRSHDLQVASSDGKTSAEVQVVPKEIAQVDDDTHDTYEEGRQAEAEGDDETAQQAKDDNKAAHDEAMDKFNERNQDRGSRIVDSLSKSGFKVRGKPVKIGGHLFVPVVDDDHV